METNIFTKLNGLLLNFIFKDMLLQVDSAPGSHCGSSVSPSVSKNRANFWAKYPLMLPSKKFSSVLLCVPGPTALSRVHKVCICGICAPDGQNFVRFGDIDYTMTKYRCSI